MRELRFPARRAEAPRRVANLPYASLGPLFKGRDAALADLTRRLRSGPCQAIHGLGGVGKTRLAIEYAWRHASDYTALPFVSARSPVELRANLAELCNPLVLNLPEQLAPHCRTLLTRLRDHVLEPKATRIMDQLAVWLSNRAEHGEAEPLYRRALAIDEKSFGPEHPDVARDLNNLAALLSATNRLAEAEPLYRRALAIGPESSWLRKHTLSTL